MALLEIENLQVNFGNFRAVEDISLSINPGDVLGVVGESGSGKSVTMMAIMGLIPDVGDVTCDKMIFDNQNLSTMPLKEKQKITGKDIAMIFQEPMTSLNPCFTVGNQIAEAIKVHQGGSKKEIKEKTIELLDRVGIPDPRSRYDNFPHQMSGGMSQRVMIAMAIACKPKLLIADEPTTALDVTIQAQVLDLLLKLQEEENMALVLITHDMGVVAQVAQDVMVMYAGQIVERQHVKNLFENPRHPYTHALLKALPERAKAQQRLPTISGTVPGPNERNTGCLFAKRCAFAQDKCHVERPILDFKDDSAQSVSVRCFYPIS